MSRQYTEGTNSTVGGPSCSYATLNTYNNGTPGGMTGVTPNKLGAGYIVPAFGAPGYGTLQYEPTCSGYPSINSAYRSKGGNCNQQYVRKLCQ